MINVEKQKCIVELGNTKINCVIAEPDKDTRELMSASGELNVPISASGEFGIALYYTGSTSGSTATISAELATETNAGVATFDGTDFTDANLDLSQRKSLCERASGTNSQTGVNTIDSLECTGLKGYMPPKPKA